MKLYDETSEFYPSGYAKKNLKPHEVWLAQRCVTTFDGGWMILQKSGVWQAVRNGHAATMTMLQNWKGDPAGHCTKKDIEEFMAGEVPAVKGGMSVPTSTERGIVFQANTFVNTWVDCILKPDADAANDVLLRPVLLLMMRVLRECLCAKDDELGLDQMITAANSDDPNELELRFVLSWLAAIVTQPGINLQTNLWLLGSMTGVGKGLILSVLMPMILGAHNCVTLNAEEIEHGGWTDCIEGKLLCVVNELEPTRKFNWNSWVKRNTTEPTVPIRKRNTHSYTALNFCNFAFTTNQELPDCLDAFDRRSMLCATTTKIEKASLALKLYEWVNSHPDQVRRMLGGFVHLLHNQRIDWAMLARAPITNIKADAQEASSKDLDAVYWLRNDDRYPRDEPLPAADYTCYYNQFMKPREPIDPRGLGKMMAQIARTKQIVQQKTYASRAARYLIPSDNFPTSDELERKSRHSKSPNLTLVEREELK